MLWCCTFLFFRDKGKVTETTYLLMPLYLTISFVLSFGMSDSEIKVMEHVVYLIGVWFAYTFIGSNPWWDDDDSVEILIKSVERQNLLHTSTASD